MPFGGDWACCRRLLQCRATSSVCPMVRRVGVFRRRCGAFRVLPCGPGRVAGALLEFQERIDDVAGHCGCHVEVLLQRYNVVCANECVWHRVQQRCGFACCVGAVICCCTNTQCHSAKFLVANIKLRRTTSPLDRLVWDQTKTNRACL